MRAVRAPLKPSASSMLVVPGVARSPGFVGSSPALALQNSRCGNHLEILWEALIDGIYTALYVYKVSRTVGFALAAFSPGLNSRRSGGSRFGL